MGGSGWILLHWTLHMSLWHLVEVTPTRNLGIANKGQKEMMVGNGVERKQRMQHDGKSLKSTAGGLRVQSGQDLKKWTAVTFLPQITPL